MRIRQFLKSLFRENAWTCADQTQAFLRGWGLFQTEGLDGEKLWELQATDDRMDWAAWAQVAAAADAQDPLSLKAMRHLERKCPDEARAIRIHARRCSGA